MPKILVSLLLVIAIYLYINNPLLAILNGVGSAKLLYPILLYLILRYKSEFNTYRCQFREEFKFYYFFVIYSAIWVVLGGEFDSFRGNIIAFIETMILPFLFLHYLKSNDIEKHGFIRLILIVGAIGAIISTVCLASPSINDFVKTSVVVMSDEDVEIYRGIRDFGLSERLASDYGVLQGAILAIGCYFMRNNKWFIPFMPLTFLSALFNARTGVVVFIVCLVVILIQNKNFKTIAVLLLFVVVFYYNFDKFLSLVGVPEQAIIWGLGLFQEMDDIRSSGSIESGTAGMLFGEMMVFPDNLFQWLFGRGINIAGKLDQLGFRSDVGFINQLNYGGLIYFTPLMFFVFLCVRKMIKRREVTFALIFFFVFLIANTKGRYLLNSGGFRLMMLIYTYLIFRVNSKRNVKNSIIK